MEEEVTFAPLAVSVVLDDKSCHKSANTEIPSVLREFDPLVLEDNTEKQYNCNSLVVNQQCFASLSPTKSSSNRLSAQRHTKDSKELDSEVLDLSSTYILENAELTEALPKDTCVLRSTAGNERKSDHIGAQILQIDSVLKALNMGKFDLSSVTGAQTKQVEKEQCTNETIQASTVSLYVFTIRCCIIYNVLYIG